MNTPNPKRRHSSIKILGIVKKFYSITVTFTEAVPESTFRIEKAFFSAKIEGGRQTHKNAGASSIPVLASRSP